MFTILLDNAFGVIGGGLGSILGILYAVLVIYGLYRVWTSPSSMGTKVLWSIAIFFLPLLGTILYLLIGD
ncbi:PLD nuclease N-terminal domain-containing protein [Bernardetia sp. ABR2-2B]|uniref:PLD nuclease N-terminal domain-containing protein n=1 Tax=Bernardetia sp. ABR2-2B TaxID=3127472 RepID=UPI0030CF270E